MGWINVPYVEKVHDPDFGDIFYLFIEPIYNYRVIPTPDNELLVLFGDLDVTSTIFILVGVGATPPGNPTILFSEVVIAIPTQVVATALGASTSAATSSFTETVIAIPTQVIGTVVV